MRRPSSDRICVAANEDGFGPSAFAYYIVRALLRSFHGEVVLLNHDALAFNQALYRRQPRVVSVAIHSLVKLVKTRGSVDRAATRRLVAGYAENRQAYREAVRPYLDGTHVAIDIGVPLFTRAAEELGVPQRITVFDHSWAATLRHYGLDDVATAIEDDEVRASSVYLFDTYVSPPPFHEHWRRLAPHPGWLHTLDGVLSTTVDRRAALPRLNRQLVGQAPITADEPAVVLISPGGTDAWRELLPRLIDQLLALSSGDRAFTPVFSAPAVSDALKERMRASRWLRWFDFVGGATQQVIMPACRVVITRAGGGTVNDALATRTPLVCVEEDQWQVELIRQQLLARGFIPDLPEARWTEFAARPVQSLRALIGHAERPPNVPRHAERAITAAAFTN